MRLEMPRFAWWEMAEMVDVTVSMADTGLRRRLQRRAVSGVRMWILREERQLEPGLGWKEEKVDLCKEGVREGRIRPASSFAWMR